MVVALMPKLPVNYYYWPDHKIAHTVLASMRESMQNGNNYECNVDLYLINDEWIITATLGTGVV